MRDAHEEAVRRHVEAVLQHVDVERIRGRKLTVALDSARGAGAEPTQALLRALGVKTIVVDAERESEPIPEQLGELRAGVVEGRADAGFAQDMDADRLALVNERGEAPGEERTLVLVLDHLLRRFPAPKRAVVKNVSTTRAVDDVARAHGARLVEARVGEVNLSRALLEAGRRGEVAFGGEGNGGVIFPPVSLGRDSLVGVAMVLDALAGGRATLSEHLAELPTYHMQKLKLARAPGATPDALYDRLVRLFPEGTPDRTDGLKLVFADGAWLGVRPSNTEPVVRVVAESSSAAWVEAAVAKILASQTSR
jgi:phosphomannomutase